MTTDVLMRSVMYVKSRSNPSEMNLRFDFETACSTVRAKREHQWWGLDLNDVAPHCVTERRRGRCCFDFHARAVKRKNKMARGSLLLHTCTGEVLVVYFRALSTPFAANPFCAIRSREVSRNECMCGKTRRPGYHKPS